MGLGRDKKYVFSRLKSVINKQQQKGRDSLNKQTGLKSNYLTCAGAWALRISCCTT